MCSTVNANIVQTINKIQSYFNNFEKPGFVNKHTRKIISVMKDEWGNEGIYDSIRVGRDFIATYCLPTTH